MYIAMCNVHQLHVRFILSVLNQFPREW
jgi:hypothetical protein